ncbi:hypothetical protein FRC04_003865 [Tulasnella sp. 424]|nr:hypothetical protein FRC04_003865 [Tulasnella sp. 424]
MNDQRRLGNLMSVGPDHESLNLDRSFPSSLNVTLATQTEMSQSFMLTDPALSQYDCYPIAFNTTQEFGLTQPLTATPHQYASSVSPHLTTPPSWNVAFTPRTGFQISPLHNLQRFQKLRPASCCYKRAPSPPQNPQPVVKKKGKRKYAGKTMKTEYYEFSSFSYYPLGPPSPPEPPVPTVTPSNTTAIPALPPQPEPLLEPSIPNPATFVHLPDPQRTVVKGVEVHSSTDIFMAFINSTPAAFTRPGEEIDPAISISKYQPRGVRWE